MKNKNVGARVIIKSVLVEISPKLKEWRYLKNVHGVIVDRGDHEQYWHTSSGGHTHVIKYLIENDCYKNFAIKMDDGVVDIEGNNIIVKREFYLKFLDTIVPVKKSITEKQYLKAKEIIQKYESQ